MGFIEGPPTFAVEVRDDPDFGPDAARPGRLLRRGDGSVWDVDPVAERIHVYRATDPDRPTTYEPGQDAEAEPAVPGWSIAVDRVFGRA